ncbi:MAG: peptidoglycan editing factor PgeF [Alicyclobacillaceae bacterium]|nr:peptidoglycan editing factor PgeF [Alicyclobacillaceae bacterium]
MVTNWTGSLGSPIWVKPPFQDGIAEGLFSFRVAGVSAPPFDSLNVGFHVPDDPACVRENRLRCAAELGADIADWVVAEQVHGTSVAVVGRTDRGRGADGRQPPVAGVDGLITAEPGVALVTLAADCVPLLFADPVRRVVGSAHSGWKGTVGHIARQMVQTMKQAFGCRPSDIEVWMGPSIRRCCYEVDGRVAEQVRTEFGNRYLLPRHGQPGKYWLGLQACIRSDLENEGVIAARIHDTGVCTSCRRQVLFSHRADGGRTGRLLAAVRLLDGPATAQGARAAAAQEGGLDAEAANQFRI